MRNRRWIAALLAIALGGQLGSLCAAKPPDLPAHDPVRCQRVEPGPLRCECDEPAPGGTAEAIDVWCTQALPVIAQRFCQRVFAIMQSPPAAADDSNTQPVHAVPAAPAAPAHDAVRDDAARGAVDPRFAATAEKARALYELATRCARQGKLAEARAHLREAHLANPTCRFGRLAIERLQELEAMPTDEEPQSDDAEAMQAERAFRRMRATTQPLGLVQPRTY